MEIVTRLTSTCAVPCKSVSSVATMKIEALPAPVDVPLKTIFCRAFWKSAAGASIQARTRSKRQNTLADSQQNGRRNLSRLVVDLK